jgi:plastocyanin
MNGDRRQALSKAVVILALVVVAVAAGAAYYYLGGGAGQGVKTVDVSIPASASSNPEVTFSPPTITLVIGVNNTVSWTNNDAVTHTVSATDGSFDSGNLAPGATFTHTFDTAGTYNYHCKIHAHMTGTVIVITRS